MGLDLAGLQHKRLKLALADDDIKGERMGDHLADLGIVGHPLTEILRHARFKALGLADIDDRVRFVTDDIHAGQQRQHAGFFVEFSFCHGQAFLTTAPLRPMRCMRCRRIQKKRRVTPPLIV